MKIEFSIFNYFFLTFAPMNILVIRFRQMGDAILATSLLNTLRHNFPEAQIHFVLNEKIAPLFQGHPSIDRIITFADEVPDMDRLDCFVMPEKVTGC